MRIFLSAVLALVPAITVLSAIAQAGPTPTPTVTPVEPATATPTATSPTPTPTTTPTAAPTASSIVTPTATLIPTPTATPSATPTPTPIIVVVGLPPDPSSGNCAPFGCVGSGESTRYQQVYAHDQFAASLDITEIRFFSNESPGGYLNTGLYEVSLSTSVNPVNALDLTDFDNNIGPDQQAFVSVSLQGEATPVEISFTGAPFHYDPAEGDLLLDIVVTGASHAEFDDPGFFDARSGTSQGVFSRAGSFGSGFSNYGLVTTFVGPGAVQPPVTPSPTPGPPTPTPTPTAPANGPVVGWGSDTYRQTIPPNAVNGILGNATEVAAGGFHSCAIQAGTGNVICWGWNGFGEAIPPDAVNGVAGTATDIAAGSDHSCAIQAGTGTVVCWGRNDNGQSSPPPRLNGVAWTATDIAAGYWHNCAIQEGLDRVVCWGDDGTFGFSSPPDAVNGISGSATHIAAGGEHSCAIQTGTGAVFC